MTDLLPVALLAICGAALVLAFLALLAFGVLRHHAPKLMEILGGAGAMLGDGEPTPQVAAQQTYRRRRPNLREKAQSLDFDSALAHNQLDSQAAGRNPRAAPPWPAANTPGATSQTSPPPLSTDVSSPLRRRRRDRNQDEIFASKLDEDGDEWMDF